MSEKLGRDRAGEPFQDEFTENQGAKREFIEQGQEKLKSDSGNRIDGGELRKGPMPGDADAPEEDK